MTLKGWFHISQKTLRWFHWIFTAISLWTQSNSRSTRLSTLKFVSAPSWPSNNSDGRSVLLTGAGGWGLGRGYKSKRVFVLSERFKQIPSDPVIPTGQNEIINFQLEGILKTSCQLLLALLTKSPMTCSGYVNDVQFFFSIYLASFN